MKLVYCLTRKHLSVTVWFRKFVCFFYVSFYLKYTEFTRYCEFYSFVSPQGLELNWWKFTISFEFGPLQVKLWHHMFSNIKMEGYMESELPGIFWVKLVTKNIVLVSLGTHFMHMRCKFTLLCNNLERTI